MPASHQIGLHEIDSTLLVPNHTRKRRMYKLVAGKETIALTPLWGRLIPGDRWLNRFSFFFGVKSFAVSYFVPMPVSTQILLAGLGVMFFSRIVPPAPFVPVAFDVRRGSYWKGWRWWANLGLFRHRIPLAEIRALQLLRKRHQRRHDGSRHSFELNLVLNNGRRLNIFTTAAGKKKVLNDAEVLARFVRKPLVGLDAWGE